MKISVVIPAWNLENYIAKAIESVLSQTIPPDEVIVVNDGSTDRTAEIVRDYPVRLINQENKGPGAARNLAVKSASGDWVAFLDGDDRWAPEKIAELRETVSQNPDLVLVGTDDFVGTGNGEWTYRALHTRLNPHDSAFKQLYRACFLTTSTVATRRETFLSVGGMNEKFRSAQDYDTWLRIVQKGPIHIIPKPLTFYTIHRPGSISSNVDLRFNISMRIARKYGQEFGVLQRLEKIALVHYEAASVAHYERQTPKLIKYAARLPLSLAAEVLKR